MPNQLDERLELKPEHVIVNLMKADKKTYLPIGRLYRFVSFLWEQLSSSENITPIDKKAIIFNINFDAIERTVEYNDKVFDLIGDMIFAKNDNYYDEIKTPEGASFLSEYAKVFAQRYVA